jgi:Mycothiol maleylpyruvate isomerase N-terminal domain
MDTEDLRRAYAEFLAAIRHGHFAEPTDGGWSAEMVLAHVVVGDRLLAEAAGRVMAGTPSSFDNLASQSEAYLQSVVEAAGGWDGLVAAVERGGEELMALARRMTDAQAATPVAATVVSDDAVVLDATVPASALIRTPADVHLRMHMQQLAALATTDGVPRPTHASAA